MAMRWVPMFFASRFSIPIDPLEAKDLLDRADQVIIARGQVPKEIGSTRRTYGARWPQYFFYHPFMLVSRTTVSLHKGRLFYELQHPMAFVSPVLVVYLWPGEHGGLGVLAAAIIWAFHTLFLFFVHRDLLLRIRRKEN